MVKKAMIFAAGLGTRLRPLTNDRPKALVEVNGMPLLEIQLKRLKNAGFESVVVNVHHFAEMVKTFLLARDWGMKIHISDESELLLDTGGGLRKAMQYWAAEDDVFVINVDVLSDLDPQALHSFHKQYNAAATLAIRDRKTDRKLVFNPEMELCGWHNSKTDEVKGKKDKEDQSFAFSGIQIVNVEMISRIPAGKPSSIIDFYLEAAKTEKVCGFLQNAGIWLDVGKPAELKSAAELVSMILPAEN